MTLSTLDVEKLVHFGRKGAQAWNVVRHMSSMIASGRSRHETMQHSLNNLLTRRADLGAIETS